LEDNSIVNSTIIIPGKMDIEKYFRGVEFAFHMKQNCYEITFKRKEVYSYIRFHTNKKLQFKQFFWTPELTYFHDLILAGKDFKYDLMNLEYYYNIFYRLNFKKKILKRIKENLCK